VKCLAVAFGVESRDTVVVQQKELWVCSRRDESGGSDRAELFALLLPF
jgi:hypothetical protein